MGAVSFLTDEHVPGPFVGILRSTGYDVLRAKDEFEEGTGDRALIDFSRETDRVVVTCDKQFTTVDGERMVDHGGVIYADQRVLYRDPEAAAGGIDRIVSAIPREESPAPNCTCRTGCESRPGGDPAILHWTSSG